MIIKRGTVLSHVGATQWGVGKVVEVNSLKATIQFSDGIIRKIASTHYATLQPADPAGFVAIPDNVATVKKVRVTVKKEKKVKQPVV